MRRGKRDMRRIIGRTAARLKPVLSTGKEPLHVAQGQVL
jgi:hypothetical protein